MKLKIVYICLFLSTLSLFAQKKEIKEKDLIFNQESLEKLKDGTTKTIKNPIKAGLYSAILPGLGQVYNRKYWKVPVVYTVLGIGGYFVYRSNKQYQRAKNAYIILVNGGVPEGFENFNKQQLADRQDQHKRDTDYAIVITSALYILNIIDAIVDAHLSEFDIDDDLALMPSVFQLQNQWNTTGIGFQIKYTF